MQAGRKTGAASNLRLLGKREKLYPRDSWRLCVNGLAPTTDWEFSGLPTGIFTITASGGTQTLMVEPGDYTLAVTPKAGYTLEVDCGNGATGSNSVTVNLTVNQTVICVFTNRAQPGTIKIVTTAVGAVPPSSWHYTSTYGGGGRQLYFGSDDKKWLCASHTGFLVDLCTGQTDGKKNPIQSTVTVD